MGDSTCKMPNCSNEPDSGKFCSTEHEVKYDHIKEDARQAKAAEEEKRQTVDRNDLPEYDGPPY